MQKIINLSKQTASWKIWLPVQHLTLLMLCLVVLQFLWAGVALFGSAPDWGVHKASGFAVLPPLTYVLVRSHLDTALSGLRSATWTVALLYGVQVALVIASKAPDLGWLKGAHVANGPLLLLSTVYLHQCARLMRNTIEDSKVTS